MHDVSCLHMDKGLWIRWMDLSRSIYPLGHCIAMKNSACPTRSVVTTSAVIMSCLPFGCHCSRSTERGCHVACALIGTYCEIATASRNQGCNAAMNGYIQYLRAL